MLIVDDSETMCALVRRILSANPDISVVGTAQNAEQARQLIRHLKPDVLTLDVEMPGISGLTFLERLMKLHPMPVVMLSSLTNRGSDMALAALAIGAVDCIEKPNSGKFSDFEAHLVQSLRMAARTDRSAIKYGRAPGVPKQEQGRWNGKTVLLGASTGGVEALETVLGRFPAECPPTVVVQHMPANFLVSFAARLNTRLAPVVRLAENGVNIGQGDIVLAPGGTHLVLDAKERFRLKTVNSAKEQGHKPSVNVLLNSAVSFSQHMIAVLLTGMGQDGANGMVNLRNNGAYCIAQDLESSVVHGMPGAAIAKGGVDEILPLNKVADEVLSRAFS